MRSKTCSHQMTSIDPFEGMHAWFIQKMEYKGVMLLHQEASHAKQTLAPQKLNNDPMSVSFIEAALGMQAALMATIAWDLVVASNYCAKHLCERRIVTKGCLLDLVFHLACICYRESTG
jgi:hypothetical protein